MTHRMLARSRSAPNPGPAQLLAKGEGGISWSGRAFKIHSDRPEVSHVSFLSSFIYRKLPRAPLRGLKGVRAVPRLDHPDNPQP
jgi:hypothetical protein